MRDTLRIKPNRLRITAITAALLAAGMLSHVEAQIQSAGTLFVDVDATTAALGSLQSITNKGTLQGSFTALGGAAATPIIAQVGGAKAIQLDGSDFLQLADDASTPILAPAELTGENPTRSIEVWVLNPTLENEETMVSWGHRGGGPDGSNVSFNYGSDYRWGAVGHWGNRDIGWNNTGGGPAAGKWHHLVYTMDGNTTRLYVDGQFDNGEYLGDGAINTHADTPILIGAQTTADGVTVEPALRFTGSIGRVRIHDGVLTAAQILNNYNFEKATFTDPTGAPAVAPERLATGPIHRYSFSEAAGAATGAIADSVGTANGVVQGDGATFTGSRLVLPGGGSDVAPYADLPNGLLSSHGVANGGSGKFSIETWVKVTAPRAWGRIFDFGSSGTVDATEEVLGPGGGGEGRDYFMYSGSNGTDPNTRRLEFRNEDPAGGGIWTVDNTTKTFNSDVHSLVTWDEDSGLITVYEDGRKVSSVVTSAKMSDLNDVNVWLGRSNWSGDQNFQGEYDEVRIYDYVVPPAVALGNAQAGPDQLNNHDFAPSFANSPVNTSIPQGQPASFKVDVYGSSPLALQWYRDNVAISGATNRTYTVPSVTINDNNAVFTVKASNSVSGASTTVASAGGTLTVVPPTDRLAAGPAHRWSFNNTAGDASAAEVVDSVGTANGVIQGDGATFTGSRVALPGGSSGSAAYVDLPNGLLSSHGVANGGSGKFTIESWFKVTGTQNWGRVFDFGSSGSAGGTEEVLGPGGAGEGRDYLMYSASNGTDPNTRRLELRNEDPAGGGVTTIDNPTTTAGQDTHIAVTWDEATGRMTVYENGAQVSTIVTDDKMSDINDVNVWLGRSNWGGDSNMQGEFDEVRIYDAVLTQRQILGDIQAGNGVINDHDVAPTIVSDPQSITLPEGGDLVLSASAQGSTPLAFQWLRNGQPIPGEIGSTLRISNVTAADNNASFTVRVSNTVNGQPASATSAVAVLTVTPAVFELRHRYSFNETSGTVVADSVGGADGELVGAGAVLGGGKATVDGTDGYVNLPNGLVSSLGVDGTIEIWFSSESAAIWARVFDFGTSVEGEDLAGTGDDFFFFVSREGEGFPHFIANYPGGGDLVNLVPQPPGWVKPHDETYVAITWSASKNISRMFIDGVLVSTNSAPKPLSDMAGRDVNNWLGRSQFAADPFWAGSYNELRFTAGALKPEQVLASFTAGPDAGTGGGSPSLTVTRSGNSIKISWPASATGFTLQSSPVLPAATWATVGTGTVNGSNLEVTVPVGVGNAFFRLMKP